ncbi:MAG: hypothetical protein DRJ63_10385 [Thermoprotei archaeon]|nr:MAG: hypothetical protein DRJ63_10385 [Thermoprotei archaeon]
MDPNVYEDVRRMVLCDRGLLRVLRGVVKGAKGVDLARGNVVREVDEDVHLFLKALYMSKGARLVKIVTGDHKARDNLLDLVDSLKEKCGRDFGIEVCYVNIR